MARIDQRLEQLGLVLRQYRESDQETFSKEQVIALLSRVVLEMSPKYLRDTYEVMAEFEPISAPELAERRGVAYPNVYGYLNTLVDLGLADRFPVDGVNHYKVKGE